MVNKLSLRDDEYEQLKVNIISEINATNAQEQFDTAQQQLLVQIKTLNPDDLFQIKNFYLTVLKWMISSQQLLSHQVKEVSTDDMLTFLIDNIKMNVKSTLTKTLQTIQTIDNKYSPGKQPWAQSHCHLFAVLTIIDRELKLESLDEILTLLNKQKDQLIQNNKTTEGLAINKFHNSLTTIKKNYEKNNDANTLKTDLNDLISQADLHIRKEKWWDKCIQLITRIIQTIFTKQPSNTQLLLGHDIKNRLKELQTDTEHTNNPTTSIHKQ